MRHARRAALFTAVLVVSFIGRAAAQPGIPDLRGTWKGQSESVVRGGGGGTHHESTSGPAEPRFTSVAFTLIIDKQSGRRFSGTFSSARSRETVIAVLSRSGTIYMVDEDAQAWGTLLAPDRMELCYLHQTPATRIASCTELTRQ
jgi:hypothetical protein